LIINHAWHYIKRLSKLEFLDQQPLWRVFCWFLTFTSIVNAWVFFRATTFNSAVEILKGMYGFNGIALPNAILVRLGNLSNIFIDLGVTSYLGGGAVFIFSYLWIVSLFFIVLIMPNTQQIMKSYSSYEIELGNALFDAGIIPNLLTFRFNSVWAFIMATVMVFAIFGLTRLSEFLYFQF